MCIPVSGTHYPDELKKIWFTALSSRLWIPISLDGWGVTIAFVSALLLINKVNDVSGNGSFELSQYWPYFSGDNRYCCSFIFSISRPCY
jgi:hypothetical protein